MKLYNIFPTKIKFNWGEMDVISLGEEGRGRRKTYVPFHADFREDGDYSVASTKTGRAKIVPDNNTTDGWIANISAEGGYRRHTIGDVYVAKQDLDNVIVLATGQGAFGDAGRIGRWYQYLVKIKGLARILVNPSGRTENYWIVFCLDRGVSEISIDEVDVFAEATGILLPATSEVVTIGTAKKFEEGEV